MSAVGAPLIAIAVVLAGFSVVASLIAQRQGRIPSEWTLRLPVLIVFLALPFMVRWLIQLIDPFPGTEESRSAPMPDWLSADSAAATAAIVAATGLIAGAICFLARARVQHLLAREVDVALLRERRRHG
ncbi:hypothetical protein [Glycomyces sp. MUSA5-2]|uniref:hypothetical protein n=1 Tax=Glycomyces sp. MUSA5-2 TaxID=2053002 RepID=UPI00300AFFD9